MRERSPYWHACFDVRDTTGKLVKRKQISTKCKDRTEALRVALTLESAANAASMGSLGFGRAMELVREIAELSGSDIFAGKTVENYATEFLSDRKGYVAPRTYVRYSQIVREFLDWLGKDRVQSPVSTVSRADVGDYKRFLRDHGNAVKTVNDKLSYLSDVFKLALNDEVIIRNPFDGMRIKTGATSTKVRRKKPFTRDQLDELIRVTEGEWRLLIQVARYTGQRLMACVNIRGRQIDWGRRGISFKPEKGRGHELFVPFHPKLEKVLEGYGDKLAAADFLFPDMASWPEKGHFIIGGKFRFAQGIAGLL